MDIYKQKYEQALENLKRIKAANRDNKELIDFIEYQYPELKESEDEKVRKIILDQMKLWNEDATKENCEIDMEASSKCIAWLEKQREKKPEIKYIYPKFRVGDVIEPTKPSGHYVPVRVKYIGEGNYSCESDDHKAFLSLPICRENEYILTEQKPTEWTEEDAKLLKLSLENLAELKHRFGEKYGKVGDCIRWIQSFKERIK